MFCMKQGLRIRGMQRGRGRRRGRFHEEEESGMTLDEWEAQQKSKAAGERLMKFPLVRGHIFTDTVGSITHCKGTNGRL